MDLAPSMLAKSTLARHRKRVIFSLLGIIILTMVFLNIKNFIGKRESEEMQKITEYINKEMDRILLFKTRDKQNEEFRKLKPKLPLEPVRMTLTTAVFKYTATKPHVILKRVIWNPLNNLNEDQMSLSMNGTNLMKTLKTFRTVRMLSNGTEQTLLWMFTEFLDVKISQKTVKGNEETIRHILRDTLIGLSSMHNRNIAHLDLKIGNIMGKTTERGIVYKIIDFGYSQNVGEKGIIEIPKKNYGTYPYKPAEIVNKSLHGLKSDIWAVGAICWFLSLQYTPFYLDNYEKDLVAYKKFLRPRTSDESENHKFFFNRETSNKLRNFVKICMEIDPNKRPSCQELLEHPFITGKDVNFPSDSFDSVEDHNIDSSSSSSY